MPFADPPEKPMVITQISAIGEPGYGPSIFGLGDDSCLYYWNEKSGEWILHKEES